MFIIEHTKMKSMSDQSSTTDAELATANQYVSVNQNYALQLAFELFGILVERCNDLMLSFIPATTLGGSDLSSGNR